MKIALVLSALIALCAAKAFEKFASEKISNEDECAFEPSEQLQRGTYESSEFQPSAQLRRGSFETPLDHFSPTDDRRLNFTYTVNLEFFKENGPLFFWTGFVLSTTSNFFIQRGLAHDVARQTGGALIIANVRYRGRNCWGNSTVENLQYLTMDHILADIPYLVAKVKEDLGAENSRVILSGCRIGGTVAALARKKFPHIVHGAWSSSGLYRAVSVETELYDSTARHIRNLGQANCSNVLASALQQIQQLVDARDSETLQRLFNLCAPIDFENPQEVQFFYSRVFSYVVNFVYGRGYAGIRALCTDLVYKNDPLKSYARWARYVFGDDDQCTNISYARALTSLQNEGCNSWARPSQYFFCTQFGLTSHVINGDVFPRVITLNYRDTFCRDVFGDVFNRTLLERASNNFNLQNGGEVQIISNAIFTNGNLDPYLSLTATEFDDHSSESVITPYIGGCRDLFSIYDTDSSQLLHTKRTVLAALTRFALPDDIDEDDSAPEPSIDLDLKYGQL